MWFVSKKKYDAMTAERDKWNGIASEAVEQNRRLLTQLDAAIKEMKDIQEFNHRLVARNKDMLAQIKELKDKLGFVIKQRDYYYDLLESANDAYEEGKAISREAE